MSCLGASTRTSARKRANRPCGSSSTSAHAPSGSSEARVTATSTAGRRAHTRDAWEAGIRRLIQLSTRTTPEGRRSTLEKRERGE